jgi:Tfp pilus assembly protein PilX
MRNDLCPRLPRSRRQHDERGIALVTTLLLLLLLTGLSLAMVLSVRSDLLINGYYRNFRGSFYAADSGLNIARQDMLNQLVAAIPANFGATTQPIPPLTENKVQTYITTSYGQFQSITGQGQAAGSWPEKFKISSVTLSAPLCHVLGGIDPCTNPTGPVTGYQYIYNYTLSAVGQSQGTEAATLIDTGSLTINAMLKPVNSTMSFAGWGMFIDQYSICDGTTLVPGTISGPVFTNGAWNFGAAGKYIFTDSVGSVSSAAGYQFSNGCDQVAGTSDKKGTTTISPTFQAGLNLGQNKVPLPLNDFNQERAVLDGKGNSNTQVQASDLNSAVRDVKGNKYPNNNAVKSPGVWLPYTVDSHGNNPTFSGGGILVEGDANVVLSTSSSPSASQIYTIKQGGTTTTITVTPTPGGAPGSGTTTVVSGSDTLTINGVPTQIDPATNHAMGDDTMLYVDGNITSLSGPGQGQPAIQDGSALTITAAGNVTITGDVLYKTEPVTQTQNQIPGAPADTLIPGNDKGQALGIFTATGDIQLNNKQSNGNLEIDASLATISQGGSGGLTNIGAGINNLTIVGGRIQNNIKNINTTTRNVFFDRRFGQNFAPPWFPSTSITLGGIESANVSTSIQRVLWQNQSSYF